MDTNNSFASVDDITVAGMAALGGDTSDEATETTPPQDGDEAETTGEPEPTQSDSESDETDGDGGAEDSGTDDTGSGEDDAGEDADDGDDPLPFLDGALARYADAKTEESKAQIANGIRKRFNEVESELETARKSSESFTQLAGALEESPDRARQVIANLVKSVADHHKVDVEGFLSGVSMENGDKGEGLEAGTGNGRLSFTEDEIDKMVDEMDLSTGERQVMEVLNKRLAQADALIAQLTPAPKPEATSKPDEGPAAKPEAFAAIQKRLRATKSGFELTEQQFKDAIAKRPDLSPSDAVSLVLADEITRHVATQSQKRQTGAKPMPTGSNNTSKPSGSPRIKSVRDISVSAMLGAE